MSEYIHTNEFGTKKCLNIFVKENLIQMSKLIFFTKIFEYFNIQIYSSHSELDLRGSNPKCPKTKNVNNKKQMSEKPRTSKLRASIPQTSNPEHSKPEHSNPELNIKGLHIYLKDEGLLWLVAAVDALIIKPIRVTLCKISV